MQLQPPYFLIKFQPLRLTNIIKWDWRESSSYSHTQYPLLTVLADSTAEPQLRSLLDFFFLPVSAKWGEKFKVWLHQVSRGDWAADGVSYSQHICDEVTSLAVLCCCQTWIKSHIRSSGSQQSYSSLDATNWVLYFAFCFCCSNRCYSVLMWQCFPYFFLQII